MEGQNNMTIPLYKESLIVGKREVDAGSVRVRKIVKTETVNQPVELRHEEIVIERQPASGETAQAGPNAFQQQQETVIQLKQEEPVIEKWASSAGQVVLQKRSSTDQRNIQEQVRSEDVDIVKSGNPNVQGSGAEGGSMGGAESSGGQTSGTSGGQTGTITDPAMLSSSSDSSSLAGRSVQFSNVKVQNVVGDRLVVLSSDNGQSLYAVCAQPATVKAGDTVMIVGTVKAGGSSANLSGEAAQTLNSQPIYIDAQRIENISK